MDCDWAQLPEELLFDIAMKLECVQELVVFSAVCSSWRAAYSKVKPIWTPTMPWLILPENRKNNPLCIRTVFDPNANKTYQVELPETFGRRCWGCQDGWIFTLGVDMEVHLFNPLTKARLSLPSAQTLSMVDYNLDYHNPRHKVMLRRDFIKRVTLVKIPPSDELLVMVVYDTNCLAFAKPGDLVWTDLKDFSPERCDVQDVVSLEGNILMVYEDGTLAFFDMSFLLHSGQMFFEASEFQSNYPEDFVDLYLVESFGDLLVVLRYLDYTMTEDPTIGYRTFDFEVLRFDVGALDWRIVKDLGDKTLFVGSNSAMSLCASKALNCKPNCIYFTDDKPYEDLTAFVGHDMGIYSLQDESIQRFYHGDDILCKFCPPFWFMPKLV